jgi:glycosyltransferase involved in cell wall biosynthesis
LPSSGRRPEDAAIRVLHIISSLTREGSGRALLSAARAAAAAAALDQTVASLRPADPWMVSRAQSAGIEVTVEPDCDGLRTLAGEAEIVQLHFWNNPWVYRLLGSELPPMRLLVWAHVSGEFPPQVLPGPLLEHADQVLGSCARTASLPGLEELEWIPAVADWERVGHAPPTGGRPFTVGYVGKLDHARLHPEFIDLCARLPVPDARFIVCGTGGALGSLRRQADEAGLGERIEFRGFVEAIGDALAEMDAFGYPLAGESYAASELSLQEAMYAGVPPVVLGPEAVLRHVEHGSTGLIARSTSEYVDGLTELQDDPARRAALGRRAHDHARREWSPSAVADRWAAVYERMMRIPKRSRAPYPLAPDGATRLAESIGDGAAPFLLSLSGSVQEQLRAERAIARSPDVLRTGDGGILNYRDAYPEDPHLRLWSGLVMSDAGRPVIAAGEFAAAMRLGLDDRRVRDYLRIASGAS